MIKALSLIGHKINSQNITIEQGFLDSISTLINHPNPFGRQPIDHIEETIESVPRAFLGSLISLPSIYNTLGLNVRNVLLSRERIVSHFPVGVRDELFLSSFLKDAYEQQASSTPIGFCIVHTFGFKAKELAFFCEKVLAIRGGFERRKNK